MEQNHPNQSTKISFLNQHVVDLFQGKNSSIGEALYGNHDFRISFKNSGRTFCNDFKSATSLEVFHMYYVILDWYCVTNTFVGCLLSIPMNNVLLLYHIWYSMNLWQLILLLFKFKFPSCYFSPCNISNTRKINAEL